MAFSSKFLHPLKHSRMHLFSFSHSKPFNSGNSHFHSFKSFMKRFEPSLPGPPSIFKSHPHITTNHLTNIFLSGSKFSCGIILGVSIAYGSAAAYAMDVQDALVDDPCEDSLDDSEEEEYLHHRLWRFARKCWVPVFFCLIVLENLKDPIFLLLTKVTLLLLGTKPNPHSVYISIDELCQRGMRKESSLHKSKSIYARKVEVQDYTLLCLANTEIRNHNYTLVGVLGNWWTLPHIIMPQEVFSFIKERLESIVLKKS